MRRSADRMSWAALLVAVAMTACTGIDPVSPLSDEIGEGAPALTPPLNPADPVASEKKTPASITVVPGEGATLNDGGFSDGNPPPEITVVRPDGTVIRPGRR